MVTFSITFEEEILFKVLACMYYDSIGSFRDKNCTIRYISQLNWNWRPHNRAGLFSVVLNYMWNCNFSEVVISASKVASVILHA